MVDGIFGHFATGARARDFAAELLLAMASDAPTTIVTGPAVYAFHAIDRITLDRSLYAGAAAMARKRGADVHRLDGRVARVSQSGVVTSDVMVLEGRSVEDNRATRVTVAGGAIASIQTETR